MSWAANVSFVGADGLEEGWSTFAISPALGLRLSLVPAGHPTNLPAINMLQSRMGHLSEGPGGKAAPIYAPFSPALCGHRLQRRIDILYALRGLASDAVTQMTLS